ncbi:MAG: CapA family protein, partial [Planctomycetaceae bacterium]
WVLAPDHPADRNAPEKFVGLTDFFNGMPALKDAGFDFINLANNHCLDGGNTSMFYTQKLIEDLGIPTGGIGKTQEQARQMQVIEKGGLTFGFLCYSENCNYTLSTAGPCFAYYEPAVVLEDIARNRSKVDVLVVSVHADLEFMPTPSMPRREEFRKFAQAGATMVLGHHPHVPQGVEMIGRSLVAYSLGNFYFSAHSSEYMKNNGPNTAKSFMLLAEVSKRGIESFTREPYRIELPPNERALPSSGPQRDEDMAYLTQLDAMVKDDAQVADIWRKIAMKHLDIYFQRVGKMDFAKFIDQLGQLTLVRENSQWVAEAFQAVKENWAQQAGVVDPYRRPLDVLNSKQKGD